MPDRTNLYKKLLNLFCYSYLVDAASIKKSWGMYIDFVMSGCKVAI